ncbi:protein NO VEIN domain-containing protein [Actinokineospora globicatena]|uniref:Protein NO VEIN C-terminal domain-containing protein n=1 Tax=Actinokineospora globicatena TaxID=103729 RepID=A0A9W6VAP8_9PSEU|nr:DUF3883 domain-containing protein [Actinokineospora globicatena]GLW92331.1 hypothetical protein Aglo03_31470 [Actinokineospora globicatena]
MEINTWWGDDPDERYWIEITDRSDVGTDLNCLQRNGSGKEYWSYSLIQHVRPGDVVLHWHKTLEGRPALIGWSIATGPLGVEQDYSWQARGSYGQQREATTAAGWRLPCTGFTRLPTPVDGADLLRLKPEIDRIRDALQERAGSPTYFPFTAYQDGGIKVAQAYITKFPAALAELILGLSEPVNTTQPGSTTTPSKQRSGTGRPVDAALRKAIEDRAVKRAKEHYLGLGAVEVQEFGKPFDLLVIGLRPDHRVEVKGTMTEARTVELTVNEVDNARDHATDLVVVHGITATARPDGGYDTTDGTVRVWEKWVPADSALAATKFAYLVDSQQPDHEQ